MIDIEGVTFPECRIAIRDNDFRYAKPPSTSLDWAGADWTFPTSLDFEMKVVTAQVVGASVRTPPFGPTDARVLFWDLRMTLRKMSERVKREGTCVDRSSGVEAHVRDGCISFRAKVWPSIPGVTVLAPDSTL